MKKLIVAFFFIVLGSTTFAQTTEISEEVKNHIKERVDEGINAGIVVALIDGKNVEYFSYGKASSMPEDLVDENSIFEIGSISKTFTGVMIADEILKGKMKASDPLGDHLPATVKMPTRNGKQITIQDVATHSSSLPRMPENFDPADDTNPYADYKIEMAYEFISGVTLDRDIGESFEYSNLALGMLGHTLELEYNKSFEEVLLEKIVNPLGMKNTRIVFTPNMKKHLAIGHDNGKEVPNWDIPALAGAGAIRSSAVDMVKYVQANMGVIDSPITDAMKYTHKTAYENGKQQFKMGFTWMFENDDKIIQHGGTTGGYQAYIGFVRGTQKGVVVLTNDTSEIREIGLKLLDDSKELIMPKKSIAIDMIDKIEEEGVESAIAFYHKSKKENADRYNLGENELNDVGYEYLGNKEYETALAIFKLNVEMFPKSSNPYDSLGEAFLAKGDTVNAIMNYKKSVEINPGNEGGIKVLEKLGVDKKDIVKEVKVSSDVLKKYIGKYQIAPGFFLNISSEGEQLFAQATGQPQFELFPKTSTEFYLKVVAASVTFEVDENGVAKSLTLFQAGREMPGKKVE